MKLTFLFLIMAGLFPCANLLITSLLQVPWRNSFLKIIENCWTEMITHHILNLWLETKIQIIVADYRLEVLLQQNCSLKQYQNQQRIAWCIFGVKASQIRCSSASTSQPILMLNSDYCGKILCNMNLQQNGLIIKHL